MQLGQAVECHAGGMEMIDKNVEDACHMYCFQMARVQDESKLPVSWLAGNTGLKEANVWQYQNHNY